MNKKEMICYETDASRLKGVVQKVFFPESLEEVRKMVKSTSLDIVPRGSGTGLVGGAIPMDSVIIDMSKMNKVTNFLPIRKTVRVEAGITLKELNDKLNSVGMEFPIDVSNNGISTIGGMIAINASGDRSMRYGNMREWIEEIEFVNGKGELVKTSKADVTDVCGMEGITGVIVAATIKLAPLIKRSASAFQSENLNEVLSIARKLKIEREVVVLELLSPFVSKLLGLPEKYNLLIEFNSNRGKIKDEKYDEILKLRKNVISKLFSEGYYNIEDPKLFFDKLKEFILFLEENNIPYIGHLGAGIIHPFFKDSENDKKEKTVEFIKKMKSLPGKFGIGIKRKYFIDNFQAKLIQRVKVRHDPFMKFNKGKLIDVQGYNISMRSKLMKEGKNGESGITKGEIEDEPKPLTGEEISAVKALREMNTCEEEVEKTLVKGDSSEKTPEEKMEDFIKEIEEKENTEKEKLGLEVKGNETIPVIKEKFAKLANFSGEPFENSLNNAEKVNYSKFSKENIIQPLEIKDEMKEYSFQEVKDRIRDYKETYNSETTPDRVHEVEKIVKNIPREIVKGEKELSSLTRMERVKVDYKEIQNIMTNRGVVKTEEKKEPAGEKGKVIITDNLDYEKTANPVFSSSSNPKTKSEGFADRKSSLSDEDKDLINKILGNKYKKDETKKNNNENKGELI